MPRRKSVNFIRPIGVDPRYGSETVQKLINVVMWRGKKNAARHIVYEALETLTKKAGGDKDKGLAFFSKSLEALMPTIEVRPRRVGGSVYQIPMEVQNHRARALAMRWLIAAAKVRPDKTMGLRLAQELLEDMHKLAEANRAFAHYAW
jgi:small subunit ribosomal protein S7